jgi:hypothetical protein
MSGDDLAELLYLAGAHHDDFIRCACAARALELRGATVAAPAVARTAKVDDRALAGDVADLLTEREPLRHHDRRGRPKVAGEPQAARLHVLAGVTEGFARPRPLGIAPARVMDSHAEMAFAELVRGVVSRELDELYARVDRIEQQLAAPRTFARAELDRQLRAAVLHARRQRLSIAMIASALGLGRSTVATILDDEQVAEPERVLGLDGKSHPARHVENGRNGNRAQA